MRDNSQQLLSEQEWIYTTEEPLTYMELLTKQEEHRKEERKKKERKGHKKRRKKGPNIFLKDNQDYRELDLEIITPTEPKKVHNKEEVAFLQHFLRIHPSLLAMVQKLGMDHFKDRAKDLEIHLEEII